MKPKNFPSVVPVKLITSTLRIYEAYILLTELYACSICFTSIAQISFEEHVACCSPENNEPLKHKNARVHQSGKAHTTISWKSSFELNDI